MSTGGEGIKSLPCQKYLTIQIVSTIPASAIILQPNVYVCKTIVWPSPMVVLDHGVVNIQCIYGNLVETSL